MQSALSVSLNQKMKMERNNTKKIKRKSYKSGPSQLVSSTNVIEKLQPCSAILACLRYLDCCAFNNDVRFVPHRAELVFADRGLTTTQCVVACDRWKQTDSLDVYRLTVVDVINSSSTSYSFAAKDLSRPVAVVMTSTAVTDRNWLR